MKNTVDFKLSYFEKGKEKIKDIKIFFSSQRVQKNYGEMLSLSTEFMNLKKQMDVVNDNIAHAIIDDKNILDTRKNIKELSKELKEIEKKMIDFNNKHNIVEKRWNICKKFLSDNGVKDDDELLSIDFWDEKVEPGEMNRFLNETIYKDNDLLKKKAPVMN